MSSGATVRVKFVVNIMAPGRLIESIEELKAFDCSDWQCTEESARYESQQRQEIESLVPVIESIFARRYTLSEASDEQESSRLVKLCVRDYMRQRTDDFSFEFSRHGRLFTHTTFNPPHKLFQQSISAIVSAGFNYAPFNLLDQDYSGKFFFVTLSWYDRFFGGPM